MQLWIVTVASACISILFVCARMPFFSFAFALLIKLVDQYALNVSYLLAAMPFVFFWFCIVN